MCYSFLKIWEKNYYLQRKRNNTNRQIVMHTEYRKLLKTFKRSDVKIIHYADMAKVSNGKIFCYIVYRAMEALR